MRRTKKRLSPGLDVIESRTLLSTGVPLLSAHALNGVVHEVRSIMGRLLRTGDTGRASADLTALASRVPSGTEELAPAWRSDVALYRPHSSSSAIGAERRILGALYRYDRAGTDQGGSPVTGPGSTNAPPTSGGTVIAGGTGGTIAPAPTLSPDSVRIQNTTGQALVVTVYLRVPQVQQPWITETIPAAGNLIVDFDFGSSTGAFMTMNVSLANGGQSPPPFSNVSLDQPIGGYDGTLFTISLFGPYFNVTPG
jgi:hypothetical protein